MMKLPETIKKLASKNGLAVLVVIIAYAIWKTYVLSTPTLEDDALPDKVRDAVLMVVSNGENDQVQYMADIDKINFGESE
jgi:hypothetical protein